MAPTLSRQGQAYLCAGLTIAFWATAGSAFKLTLRRVPPEHMLLWSVAMSVVLLAVIAASTGRAGELRRWRGTDWLRSAGLGFLNPCLYYLVLFAAYDRLPAQEALALNFVWPIVLVLVAIVFLGQPVTARTLAAMLVSFSGAVVVATRGEVAGLRLSDPVGIALATGSSLVWAAVWIAGVRDRCDPVARLFANFLFGTAWVAAWVLARGVPGLPGPAALAGCAWIAAFEMGFSFVLWQAALRLSRTAAQVSNLIYLTPFLSLVVIALIVGESIRTSTVIGLLLIVGGIALQHARPSAAGR